jgi:hypothetical protein
VWIPLVRLHFSFNFFLSELKSTLQTSNKPYHTSLQYTLGASFNPICKSNPSSHPAAELICLRLYAMGKIAPHGALCLRTDQELVIFYLIQSTNPPLAAIHKLLYCMRSGVYLAARTRANENPKLAVRERERMSGSHTFGISIFVRALRRYREAGNFLSFPVHIYICVGCKHARRVVRLSEGVAAACDLHSSLLLILQSESEKWPTLAFTSAKSSVVSFKGYCIGAL